MGVRSWLFCSEVLVPAMLRTTLVWAAGAVACELEGTFRTKALGLGGAKLLISAEKPLLKQSSMFGRWGRLKGLLC